MEQPWYVLTPKTSRAIIPSALTLTFLSLIFYLGILLNISLLQLSSQQETALKTVSLLLLLAIILLGIFLSGHNIRPYTFYHTFLEYKHRNIPYASITTPKLKQNLFDRLLHTYQLDLGNKVVLQNIPQDIELNTYLTQLHQYAQDKY